MQEMPLLQKSPLEESPEAVSYTHLDVYKRQTTSKGYTTNYAGCTGIHIPALSISGGTRSNHSGTLDVYKRQAQPEPFLESACNTFKGAGSRYN